MVESINERGPPGTPQNIMDGEDLLRHFHMGSELSVGMDVYVPKEWWDRYAKIVEHLIQDLNAAKRWG